MFLFSTYILRDVGLDLKLGHRMVNLVGSASQSSQCFAHECPGQPGLHRESKKKNQISPWGSSSEVECMHAYTQGSDTSTATKITLSYSSGAREMAQWLTVLAAVPEDPGSVLSCLELHSRWSEALFWPLSTCTLVTPTHTH